MMKNADKTLSIKVSANLWCLCGAAVRASDFRSSGCCFDSRPGHNQGSYVNSAFYPFCVCKSSTSVIARVKAGCVHLETDAKIITASPLENWRKPPGRPRTTWMKTIQQYLRSNNLSLDEAITVAQNRPLWRLMSAFGATLP